MFASPMISLVFFLLASKIGYFSKTHSLGRLIEEAKEVSGSISDFHRKFRDKLGLLEDAYISSRYLGRRYKREDVEDLFVVFEELLRLVGCDEAC